MNGMRGTHSRSRRDYQTSFLQSRRWYFSLYEIFAAVKVPIVDLKSIRFYLGCDSCS
jgi:hypothetical protein